MDPQQTLSSGQVEQRAEAKDDGKNRPDEDTKNATGGSCEKIDSVAEGQVEELRPFEPLRGVETFDGRRIFTFRAVFSGFILGSVILCSNLYLGLKTGFGADATLFSSIFGFAICKGLEKSKIPFLSGHFGPHENNIIQATAVGCMGIGFMFVSAVPAMYHLKLLDTPESDLGKLICFALVAGLWGLGFTVPLRSMFILRLARQLNLVFPYGTASAVTIRALHSGSSEQGYGQTKDNVRGISITFLSSLVWSVATSYAPGILYTWNPFWWIYKWGGHSIIAAINWGWVSWSWSPSLIGIGMLIDLNSALSLLFGTVLAWGVIGPILVRTNKAIGVPYDPNYPDLVTYNAFIPDQFISMPSPRYWVLWPAVFMMLGVSLTMILLEARSIGRMMRLGFASLRDSIRRSSRGSQRNIHRAPTANEIPDPVAPEHQVRWWEWTSVATVSFIIGMVALKYLYGMSPGITLVNFFLGVFWSFVVIHVLALTGATPISTVAKGSQFITGAILRDQMHSGFDQVARSNLVGALVSSAATQQAAELCQDFRTGFLLGTPARSQWHAQLTGTLTSIVVGPALFLLFTKAFPCILDGSSTTCQFAMPSAVSWRVVTEAIFMPKFPISQSSWIFSIIFTAFGISCVVLQHWLRYQPTLSSWKNWVPNMSLVGLAMTIPGSNMTLTIALGAVATASWKRYSPGSHGRFLFAVASGGVAGEGVAFVVQAILQIAMAGGPNYYGTMVGCVAEQC
ncbi:OPT oligopeptide transporter protein-domain-containing protein [Ilyonectria sp. MPI-CAGE-AT-0026]|nr:OPT oligopeptide transporter protein-domain-containing protein [Ilyonectria sp. MPI-CAGE-AT-0026]